MRNLYLEGANWDFEKSCICEPVPLKFIARLPVIHFQPVITASKKKSTYRERRRDLLFVLRTLRVFQATTSARCIIIHRGAGHKEGMLL